MASKPLGGTPRSDEPVFDDLELDYGRYWRDYNKHIMHHAALFTFRHDYGVGSKVSERDAKQTQIGQLVKKHSKPSRSERKLVTALSMLYEWCNNSEDIMHIDSATCDTAAKYAHRLAAVTDALDYRHLAFLAAYAALVNNCYPQILLNHLLEKMVGDPGTVKAFMNLRRIHKYLSLARIPLRCGRSDLMRARLVNYIFNRFNVPEEKRQLAWRINALYPCRSSAVRSCASGLAYITMKLLDMNISQQMIAEKIGVTEANVRAGVKAINPEIEYIVCYDSGCRSWRKILYWRYGITTVGISTPGDAALYAGFSRYTYEVEIGRPIRVKIYPQYRQLVVDVAEQDSVG